MAKEIINRLKIQITILNVVIVILTMLLLSSKRKIK